jgi:hypothetical protein
MNVMSDIYLLSIPVPMLWNSTLKPWKKAGLIFLFSGGVFIIACGLARAILIVAVSCPRNAVYSTGICLLRYWLNMSLPM